MNIPHPNFRLILSGSLIELRPLQLDDFTALFAAAADPLIWEQHPDPERHKPDNFRKFFDHIIESKGALAVVELKSRKIKFPKTRLTRPMTDRSKETVFNILGGLVIGKHVLDLYAGSGSLGLESLSRGALDATFIDKAPMAVKTIQDNITDLKLSKKALILQGDVLLSIDKLKKRGCFFSLVFVDPPFNQGLVKKTLIKLDQSGIVLPFGQVVVGHTRQEELPDSLQTLKLARTKKVGQACLSFLFRLDSNHGETKSYLSGEL